jgi:hypothetical protein
VNVRARVAFATGVAGLAGAMLILTGRIDGSVALALLFASGARAAAAGTLMGGGPLLADQASRSLGQQARFAPAWALVAIAGAIRAGSASLADARGANAVAGLAIARGPALTVVGMWLAVAAGAVAIVSYTSIGVRTASADAPGIVAVPVALRRLEVAAVVAQAALLVTLFAGPQVIDPADAAWWVAGIGTIVALAWKARKMPSRDATLMAIAAAVGAVVLSLVGGAP